MLGNQTFEILQPSKTFALKLESFGICCYVFDKQTLRNFKPGIPLLKDFGNEVIQMSATRPISEICERYRINRSNVWLPRMTCLHL